MWHATRPTVARYTGICVRVTNAIARVRTANAVSFNPVSIDERPAIVNERSRVGDWEVDTVLGKQGSGAIVSLLERKSRLYLVQYVPSKNSQRGGGHHYQHAETLPGTCPYPSQLTMVASLSNMNVLQQSWKRRCTLRIHTVHGNGDRMRIAMVCCGNMLPKGSDLSVVTAEALSAVEKRLNFRPRKCLGFKQPQVVFDELLKAA